MVEIYAVNIHKPISNDKYREYLHIISEDRQLKLNNYRFHDDIKRSLFGDLMARYLANIKLGLKSADILFCSNEFGKPYIRHYPEFNFNISHSGKWVVCALSRLPVGIDIEHMKESNLSIAKRYFTNEEYKIIINSCEETRKEMFYRLWTLKESYIKLIGKGLSVPLNSFSFYKEGEFFKLVQNKYKFNSKIMDDYILSIAYQETLINMNIIEIDINSFSNLC